ncbi:MAG: DUF5615 family PIN-like protein [Planctomycetota bacterium]
MRFKTDENVHPQTALFLRRHGHDAVTVWDQNLRGSSDLELGNVCRRELRVLITLDQDFADIRRFPPEEFEGILVLRLRRSNRRETLRVLDRMIPLLENLPLKGHLWIVDDNGIRIRGPLA